MKHEENKYRKDTFHLPVSALTRMRLQVQFLFASAEKFHATN
jgi:hypothetical protein